MPTLEPVTDDPTDPDQTISLVGSDRFPTDPQASDAEPTRPLPQRLSPFAGDAESDTELTRPLPMTKSEEPRPATLPSRMAPARIIAIAPRSTPRAAPAPKAPVSFPKVPVVVASPAISRGTVENAPSIQIARTSPPVAPKSVPPRRPGARSTAPTLPPQHISAVARPSLQPLAASIPPAAPARSPLASLAMISVAVAAVVITVLVMRLRPGALVMTASTGNGSAVSAVTFLVDGQPRCDRSPCELTGLKPGTHLISASANGFGKVAERALVIEPGQHAAHHVALVPEAPSAARVAVSTTVSGAHVWVDGSDHGEAPVTVRDLLPGQHSVRIVGPERRYRAFDDTLTLEAGEFRTIGPVRLEPVDDAPASTAVAPPEAERERVVPEAPAKVRPIAVQPRKAALAPAPPKSSTAAPAKSSKRETAEAPAPATPELATLQLTSAPRAAVVVNGRPMGMTPLGTVRVPPGTQTVVFIHPELGRKVATVDVSSGGTRTVAVTF